MNKLLDESQLNPAEYEEVVFHDPDPDLVPDNDSDIIEPEQI
jgi:hypothetical protein